MYNTVLTLVSLLKHPALENLLMDVYEPAGDTETDRPVVVMLHTGSFYTSYCKWTTYWR